MLIKSYNTFVNDCNCCSHVNRNRHNVETRMSVTDGQIVSASCSWCGKSVEVPREQVLHGTKLVIGILSDADYLEQLFLFEGQIYYGLPLGEKRLVSKFKVVEYRGCDISYVDFEGTYDECLQHVNSVAEDCSGIFVSREDDCEFTYKIEPVE